MTTTQKILGQASRQMVIIACESCGRSGGRQQKTLRNRKHSNWRRSSRMDDPTEGRAGGWDCTTNSDGVVGKSGAVKKERKKAKNRDAINEIKCRNRVKYGILISHNVYACLFVCGGTQPSFAQRSALPNSLLLSAPSKQHLDTLLLRLVVRFICWWQTDTKA